MKSEPANRGDVQATLHAAGPAGTDWCKAGLWRLLGMLLCILCAGCMLEGCIMDPVLEEEIPAPGGGGVRLNIQIRIPASDDLSTRAESGPGGTFHTNSPGTAAESYINIADGDYRVLVFDGADRLYQPFTPDQWTVQESSPSSESIDKIYTLSGLVSGHANDQIRIMVLANWNSFDADNTSKYNNFWFNQQLADIYGNDTDFNFTLPRVQRNATTWESWQPSAPEGENGKRRAIPMFGVSELMTLPEATGKEVVSVGTDVEIPMLRAIAKIVVVDGTPSNISISDVFLSSYNTKGRFIPDVTSNPGWGMTDVQVTSPSLPAVSDAVPFSGEELHFFKSGNTYVAYVPEMDLSGFGTDERERPAINVKVNDTVTQDDNYTLRLADYGNSATSANPALLAAVLRNHIYHYTITGVSPVGLTVQYTVCPWDRQESGRITFS